MQPANVEIDLTRVFQLSLPHDITPFRMHLHSIHEHDTDRSLIHLDGVKKVFLTDEVETHALAGIYLDIQPGEYVAIAGPSGCGKSTLLSILGLLDSRRARAATCSTASRSRACPSPSARASATARSASSSRAST